MAEEKRFLNGLYGVRQRISDWEEKVDEWVSNGIENVFSGIDHRERRREQQELERETRKLKGKVSCRVVLLSDKIIMDGINKRGVIDPRGSDFPNMRLPIPLYGEMSNSGVRLVPDDTTGDLILVADVMIFKENPSIEEEEDDNGRAVQGAYNTGRLMIGENAIKIVRENPDTFSNSNIRPTTNFELHIIGDPIEEERLFDDASKLELKLSNVPMSIPESIADIIEQSDNISQEVRDFCSSTGLDENEVQHYVDMQSAEIKHYPSRNGDDTYVIIGEQGWYVAKGSNIFSVTPNGADLRGEMRMDDNPAVPNMFDTSKPNQTEKLGIPQILFFPFLRYLPEISKVARWVDFGVHVVKCLKSANDYLHGIRTDDEVNRLFQAYQEAKEKAKLEREARAETASTFDTPESFIRTSIKQEGYRGTFGVAYDSRNDFEQEFLDDKSEDIQRYLDNKEDHKDGVWLDIDTLNPNDPDYEEKRSWIEKWRDDNGKFKENRERDEAERQRKEEEAEWVKPSKEEEPYNSYGGGEDAF